MSALDDYDALYDSAYWRVQDENQQLLHDVERLGPRKGGNPHDITLHSSHPSVGEWA